MSKVITPKAILSYPHLAEPTSFEGQKPKFSASLVFPEGTDLSAIEKAVDAVGKEKWGAKWTPEFKTKLRYAPIREGETEKGHPAGSKFLNAKSDARPGLVRGDLSPVAPEEVREVFYPGCKVRAQVSVFEYDHMGNKGISFGLNNLQFMGHGERLDGRTPATEAFGIIDEEMSGLDDIVAA